MGVDPSGFVDGLNLYAYVGNDPLNFVDPLGLGREGLFGFDLDSNLLADFSDFGTGALSDINHTYSLIEQDVSKIIADPVGEGLEMLNSAPPALGIFAAPLSISRTGVRISGSIATKIDDPLARGVASEARVLDDLGLTKNTTRVTTTEGSAIPDALTATKSIEIKDTICVTCTKQIRIKTDAARTSARDSILITGTKTNVNRRTQRAFDYVIRRDDLGPQ